MEIVVLPKGVLARTELACDSEQSNPLRLYETGLTSVTKSPKREKTAFGKDRRRKHHNFLVTVFYADGEKFGRVYTDKEKADRFAERQKRSPVVKSARVTQVS